MKHFYDLHYWRMTPKFLIEFPELKPDIPTTPMPPLEQSVCQWDNTAVFGMEREGLGHGNTPQTETLTPGFVTEYSSVDWPANQSTFL